MFKKNLKKTIKIAWVGFIFGVSFFSVYVLSKYITTVQNQTISQWDTMGVDWFQKVNDFIVQCQQWQCGGTSWTLTCTTKSVTLDSSQVWEVYCDDWYSRTGCWVDYIWKNDTVWWGFPIGSNWCKCEDPKDWWWTTCYAICCKIN